MLLIFGVLLAATGAVLLALDRFGLSRLPGDFVVQRGPVTFFFPLATSLVVSAVLTLVINLVLRRAG
jgi:hypothetical protein